MVPIPVLSEFLSYFLPFRRIEGIADSKSLSNELLMQGISNRACAGLNKCKRFEHPLYNDIVYQLQGENDKSERPY